MYKCKENIIGKPVFKIGDIVGFYLIPYDETEKKFFKGTVEIIDVYGTFFQDKEPSYDIMVENYNGTGKKCLVKHIKQSECYILEKKDFIIENLELIKSQIEWDYNLDYQIMLNEAINYIKNI